MEGNKRLYPIKEERFKEVVLLVIAGNYILKGHPPKLSPYKVFCGIRYILRTGCSWRNLPTAYGYWYVVYERFSRGSERGLWAKVWLALQQEAPISFEAKVPPEILYHGTTERFVSSIMGNGIKAMTRQYVHLSSTEETAIMVGRRRGKPFILKINARKMCEDGYKFYLSENKVWLTDFVPKEYINKEQIIWYVSDTLK